MTTATKTIVTDNRDATADDAVALKAIYARLLKADKATKKAGRATAQGWVKSQEDRETLQVKHVEAIENQYALMEDCWTTLTSLPNNTVASGGATPQTVALQFFNRNLNRNLKSRMTAADAKRVNKLSFDG